MKASDFKFSAATEDAEIKAEKGAAKDPQAYIFIGADPFRSDERSPQEWRKLFVVLSRMARGQGGDVSQNNFGLAIVYDKLVEFEAAAKKSLGAKYDAAVAKHWADAQAEDAARAKARAARKAADAAPVAKTGIQKRS